MRLLRVGDVDLERAIIRFRRAKGGKTLEVALHPETRAAVTRYLEHGRPALLAGAVDGSGFLFLSARHERGPQPLTRNSLSLMLRRRYHAGGGTLPTFGSHRIRHATATLLVNHGMPLEEVSPLPRAQLDRRHAPLCPADARCPGGSRGGRLVAGRPGGQVNEMVGSADAGGTARHPHRVRPAALGLPGVPGHLARPSTAGQPASSCSGTSRAATCCARSCVEASGACAWDGATPFPSDMDPQAVWDQVEQQLDLIGAMGEWGPDEPTVVDATGFGAGTETARVR